MSSQRYLQFQSTGIILALSLSIFVISLSVFPHFHSSTTEKLVPSSLNIFTYCSTPQSITDFLLPTPFPSRMVYAPCLPFDMWTSSPPCFGFDIPLWIAPIYGDCPHSITSETPCLGILLQGYLSHFAQALATHLGLSPSRDIPCSLLILLVLQHFLQDSPSSTAPMLMLTLLNPT